MTKTTKIEHVKSFSGLRISLWQNDSGSWSWSAQSWRRPTVPERTRDGAIAAAERFIASQG